MARIQQRSKQLLALTALVAGVAAGTAGIASAATSSSSTTTPAATTPAPSTGSSANAPDPATLAHGPNETLLTGSDLTKATAAANAAVSGATIVRAETDSSGDATYEVHMKKADGTYVTVELDSSFNVTGTVSGFGAGPKGATAPSGQAPAQAPSSSSSSTTN